MPQVSSGGEEDEDHERARAQETAKKRKKPLFLDA